MTVERPTVAQLELLSQLFAEEEPVIAVPDLPVTDTGLSVMTEAQVEQLLASVLQQDQQLERLTQHIEQLESVHKQKTHEAIPIK